MSEQKVSHRQLKQEEEEEDNETQGVAEAMTYDEISMKRSKHFISALQELKNLRPQLYSAAEYCETSYLQNEEKQAVLENLKEYAVKALVNAVDHLGTVAYKLNDLLDQQVTELSTAEVMVASLSQRLEMCQEYSDRQELKQHFLVKNFPKYHKHYILPYQNNKQINNTVKKNSGKIYESEHAKPHPLPHGANTTKSLSWHLAAEARTAFNENSNTSFSNEFHSASSFTGSEPFFFSEAEYSSSSFPPHQSRAGVMTSTCSTPPSMLGTGRRDFQRSHKKLAAHLSFNEKHQIRQPLVHHKSLLSTLFTGHKYLRQKFGANLCLM